jgi:DNA-binding NtrC family response regulator
MAEQSTVLVVDDEIGPRESLRAILKPDYQVLVASEGEQALHLVEQQPVDVVLLDLRMPGVPGIQVLEKIKSINPSIQVIVVTGYASYETVLEGLRLHAFDYISKPFNIPHLRDLVKRAATQGQLWPQRAKEVPEQQLRELLQNLVVVSDSLQQSLQTLSQVIHALQNNYANFLNAPSEETS